jgi:hypothetical protein
MALERKGRFVSYSLDGGADGVFSLLAALRVYPNPQATWSYRLYPFRKPILRDWPFMEKRLCSQNLLLEILSCLRRWRWS